MPEWLEGAVSDAWMDSECWKRCLEWLGGVVSDAWMDSECWKRCLSGLVVWSAMPEWAVSAGSDALSGMGDAVSDA